MRAHWHAFHQRLTSLIHRTSSEQQYEAIRVRYPALATLPNIDQVIFHQQSPGGDPEQRNAVLRSLVVEAQAGAVTSELAANLLVMALWPGLDAVYSRLCRDYPHERADISDDVVGQVMLGIGKLDLSVVNRLAATLIMNAERDLRRVYHTASRQRRSSELLEDNEGALAIAGPEDATDSAWDWYQLLNPIIGRDTPLFLRIICFGETQAEAASALGLSYDGARKRHQRAMKKLTALQKTLPDLSQ